MKLQTRSILQELNSIADVRSTDSLIESRAANIINSAINLLESIHKNYDSASADELMLIFGRKWSRVYSSKMGQYVVSERE